jgi:hypothetical protein
MSKGNLVNVDVGGLAQGLFALIDQLFTSEEERQDAKLRLIELQQKGQLAQLAVNAAEAQHENIFVAGWRPFIGWVCGFAFAYTFIFQPFATFIIWAIGTFTDVSINISTLPTLDMSTLLTVLGGMLGLGALRTYEKATGTNTNRVVNAAQVGTGGLY